jgi:hypothetical protein
MAERSEETDGLGFGSCCFFGFLSVEQLDCQNKLLCFFILYKFTFFIYLFLTI